MFVLSELLLCSDEHIYSVLLMVVTDYFFWSIINLFGKGVGWGVLTLGADCKPNKCCLVDAEKNMLFGV